MTNTTARPARTLPDLLNMMLRGAGQVMFQNNAWTGAFFLLGIFWGAWEAGTPAVAWGALLGLAVSTATGFLLPLPANEGSQGLWGFNGILVGCAFPTFLGNTLWMWLALILCAALTTWVRTGLNNVMAPWKVNSLTFPFVLCTWFFLLAARAMHGIPPAHLADPALPGAFAPFASADFADLLAGWLRGIAQVFLIDSWITGALFLLGLLISDRRAALWAAVGSALALATAVAMKASGADIASGLYGYSATLTAIALATVFYKPNRRSALWALVAIPVTVFVQAALNTLAAPTGLAALTAPFCIATWLFLLPRLKMDATEQPDHSNWSSANSTPKHDD